MRFNRSRISWTFAFLTLICGTGVTLFDANTVQSADEQPAAEAKATETPDAAPKKDVITTSAADECLSDPVVLDELTKKRQELEAREKELQSREAELKARETAINDEFKKLQDTRDEIAKLDDSRKQANQEKVAKVIETLQAMSPKASAQFLTTLDDNLAVAAISQMDTVKLAKIMNVIDARRGAKLTELLAGVVRAHNSATQDAGRALASSDATETTISPQVVAKRGGEKNDTNNKPNNIISGGPDLAAKGK